MLKVILHVVENDSKYRDVAPLSLVPTYRRLLLKGRQIGGDKSLRIENPLNSSYKGITITGRDKFELVL